MCVENSDKHLYPSTRNIMLVRKLKEKKRTKCEFEDNRRANAVGSTGIKYLRRFVNKLNKYLHSIARLCSILRHLWQIKRIFG